MKQSACYALEVAASTRPCHPGLLYFPLWRHRCRGSLLQEAPSPAISQNHECLLFSHRHTSCCFAMLLILCRPGWQLSNERQLVHRTLQTFGSLARLLISGANEVPGNWRSKTCKHQCARVRVQHMASDIRALILGSAKPSTLAA